MARRKKLKGRRTLIYTRERDLRVVMGVKRGSQVPFTACARVSAGAGKIRFPGSQCAGGKNPRNATARALHKLAKVLNRRAGAFAGF